MTKLLELLSRSHFSQLVILLKNVFISVSSIIAVFFLTNNISKAEYAEFIYIVTLFSLIALLYDQFDLLIPKFYSSNIYQIVAKILILKVSIIFFSIIIYFFFFPNIKISFLFFISVYIIFEQVYRTLNVSFITIKGIKIITDLEFIFHFFAILFLLYYTLNKELSIDLYLKIYTTLYLFLIIIITKSLKFKTRDFKSGEIIVEKNLMVKYLLPLQLVSIQSAFKSHVLKIIIYNISGPTALYNFDIIIRIFSKIYEIYTSLIKKYTPFYIKNKFKFNEVFFTKVLFSINAALFIIIVFLYLLRKRIFLNFNIEYNDEINFIFFILTIELILNVYGQLSNLILKSADNTKDLLYSSLIRLFFSIFSIPIFIYFFNVNGIYYSKVLSTLLLVYTLTYYRRKLFIIPKELFLLLFTIILTLILFYANKFVV